MRHDARQVHSRWMIRAMEWNDAKARYPNLWHEGMPRSLVVFDRVANRVRLGDLLAVYYPTSQRHAERAERYLGLSRVVGLRRGDESGFSWIDLQTAHRFGKPLENAPPPRRVFLCCDPGWPEPDVARFQSVFDAAVAEGFEPEPEDLPPEAQPEAKPDTPNAKRPGSDRAPIEKDSLPTAVEPSRPQATRSFGGVAYGGDMRDPRDGTWLAFRA